MAKIELLPMAGRQARQQSYRRQVVAIKPANRCITWLVSAGSTGVLARSAAPARMLPAPDSKKGSVMPVRQRWRSHLAAIVVVLAITALLF